MIINIIIGAYDVHSIDGGHLEGNTFQPLLVLILYVNQIVVKMTTLQKACNLSFPAYFWRLVAASTVCRSKDCDKQNY